MVRGSGGLVAVSLGAMALSGCYSMPSQEVAVAEPASGPDEHTFCRQLDQAAELLARLEAEAERARGTGMPVPPDLVRAADAAIEAFPSAAPDDLWDVADALSEELAVKLPPVAAGEDVAWVSAGWLQRWSAELDELADFAAERRSCALPLG